MKKIIRNKFVRNEIECTKRYRKREREEENEENKEKEITK